MKSFKYCDFCGAPPSTRTTTCAPPFKVQKHQWTGKHPADAYAELEAAPSAADQLLNQQESDEGMITSATFRAMEEYTREMKCWHIHHGGGGWFIAEDSIRDYDREVGQRPSRRSYTKYDFSDLKSAQDFISFRSHRAALIAALQFWRS